MSSSLLNELKGLVTPQLLNAAAARWGESESSISKGLGGACPAILAALLPKLSDPSFLSQMMSLLTKGPNTPDVLDNPTMALPGGPASSAGLTDLGSRLLSSVFGGQLSSVTSALASQAGIKSTSASSLMSLAASLVTATLGDRIRRDGLSATGLASLLNSERDSLLNAVPAALSGIAGLGSAGLRSERSVGTEAVREVRQQGTRAWLWGAAAALLLLVGGWWLWNNMNAPEVGAPDAMRRMEEAAQRVGQVAGDAPRQVGEAASDAAHRAGQAIGDAAEEAQVALGKLGSFTTRRLPSNVELKFPERGVESQVIAYLNDPNTQLEPVVWFNFDRLLFETGSATLKPESQEQLKNFAEIMKAYPTVKVKIGGYTDSTGDAAANLKLSQDRATNVVNAVVALGVAADRLNAEGYGAQHPVADNATEAGRAANRRIAFRVIEK